MTIVSPHPEWRHHHSRGHLLRHRPHQEGKPRARLPTKHLLPPQHLHPQELQISQDTLPEETSQSHKKVGQGRTLHHRRRQSLRGDQIIGKLPVF